MTICRKVAIIIDTKLRYIGTDVTRGIGKAFYCQIRDVDWPISSRVKLVQEDPGTGAILPPIIYSSYYDLLREWEIVEDKTSV